MSNANSSQLALWTTLIATNSPPSGVPDKVTTGTSFMVKVPATWESGALFIKSTAGTTPTVTAKAWGYADGVWFPLGPDPTGAGDATKFGLLNEGDAIGPYTGNVTRWTDILYGLSGLEGFYLEATAISGASAAFTALLKKVRA